MKPTNVSVSVTDCNGSLKVWNAAFSLNGSLPMINGKVDEAKRQQIQNKIASILSQIDFDL